MKLLKASVLFGLIFCFSLAGYAQCPPVLDQQYWNMYAGTSPQAEHWQSFTCGASGKLSRVSLNSNGGISTTLTISIYEGTGTTGALLYSGSYPFNLSGTQIELTCDIPCDQMPDVVQGNVYTLRVQGSFNTIYNSTNPYAGGYYYNTSNGVQTGWDMMFKTWVSEPNTPTFFLSPTNPSCYGYSDGSVTSTVTSGVSPYSYSWSGGQTTANLTSQPSGGHTLTITDANNCVSCPVFVNLLDPPQITVNAGADQSICAGDVISIGLSATNAQFYNWSPSSGLSSPTSLITNASPTATTNYIIVASDTNGCVVSDDVVITVNPLPTVNGGADLSVCDGDLITLTGTGTASSYIWDNSVLDGTPFNQPVGTVTYTVTGTDANGCQNTDVVDVTVNSLPTVTLNLLPDQCSNNGLYTFTEGFPSGGTYSGTAVTSGTFDPASAGAGTYMITYTYTDGNGCISNDQQNIVVYDSPVVTFSPVSDLCQNDPVYTLTEGSPAGGVYSGSGVTGNNFDPGAVTPGLQSINYTYTDGNGCSDNSIQNIDVLPTPTVTASSDISICEGDSTIVSVTGSAVNYNWDNGLGSGLSHTVNPTITTTYIVTGTGSNGCSEVDQILVSVNSLPVVNFSAVGDMCIDAPNYTLVEGTPGGGIYSGPGVSAGMFMPSAVGAGSFTIYYDYTESSTGCSNVDSTDILVYGSPTVVANASDIDLCDGESVVLTGSGANSYSWDNGVNDGVSFSPAIGMVTYTVTGTDLNGCQGTDQIDVTVYAIPTVDAGIDQTVCQGDAVILSGSGASSYVWNNGISDGMSFNPSVGSDYYIVTGTDANGCQNTDSVLVTTNPNPVLTVSPDQYFCAGDQVDLTASGANSYDWDSGASTASTYSFSPLANITIPVIGTSNGCSTTAYINLTLDDPGEVDAGQDQEICEGFDFTLNGAGGIDYIWNGPQLDNYSGQSVTLEIDTTAYYYVTVTTGNACIYTDSVLISLSNDPSCNIIPVTALTPNGDAVNDFWKIEGIEGFTNNHVIIFNRWGDKVFDEMNYDNDLIRWEGTSLNGEKASPGTYYYLIEIENGPTTNGWVQLMK